MAINQLNETSCYSVTQTGDSSRTQRTSEVAMFSNTTENNSQNSSSDTKININNIYAQYGYIWESMGLSVEDAKKYQIIERIVGSNITDMKQVEVCLKSLNTVLGNSESIKGIFNSCKNAIKKLFNCEDTINEIIQKANEEYTNQLKDELYDRGIVSKIFNRKSLRAKIGIDENVNNPDEIRRAIEKYLDENKPLPSDSIDVKIKKTEQLKKSFVEIIDNTEGEDVSYLAYFIKYISVTDRMLAAELLFSIGATNPDLKSKIAKEIGFEFIEITANKDVITDEQMNPNAAMKLGINVACSMNKKDHAEYLEHSCTENSDIRKKIEDIQNKIDKNIPLTQEEQELYDNRFAYLNAQTIQTASCFIGTELNNNLDNEYKTNVYEYLYEYSKTENIQNEVFNKVNDYIKSNAQSINININEFESKLNKISNNEYNKCVKNITSDNQCADTKQELHNYDNLNSEAEYTVSSQTYSKKYIRKTTQQVHTETTAEQSYISNPYNYHSNSEAQEKPSEKIRNTEEKLYFVNYNTDTKTTPGIISEKEITKNCKNINEILEMYDNQDEISVILNVLNNIERFDNKTKILESIKKHYVNYNPTTQMKIIKNTTVSGLNVLLSETKDKTFTLCKNIHFANNYANEILNEETKKREEENASITSV